MALATTTMRAASSVTANKSSRRVIVPRAALLTTVKVAKKTTKQQQERKAPVAGFEIGFTPSNEVLLGRLSMLGFGSAVVGEFLSGQGPLAQLGYELGLQQEQVGIFLAGLIGFNLVASLLPNSATFKQQPQQQDFAAGPLQDPTITLLQPAKFFNVTNWGFTPQNELFAGRLAALGMVAAIVGELVTGLGPVGQLSAETGIPTQSIFFALTAWASFMACTAVDKLAVKRKGKTVSSRTTAGTSGTVSQ